jgi:hypothetical protein
MLQRGNCPFSNLKSKKYTYKTLQRLKPECQKSPALGLGKLAEKNLVSFGEVDRKLPKLSMPIFTYRSSS